MRGAFRVEGQAETWRLGVWEDVAIWEGGLWAGEVGG